MNLVKGLLAKLRQAGVTGPLHTLLESYLSDRIARTRVEGECSSEQILALIDCLEIKKYQTGVDDDWEVSFLLTF